LIFPVPSASQRSKISARASSSSSPMSFSNRMTHDSNSSHVRAPSPSASSWLKMSVTTKAMRVRAAAGRSWAHSCRAVSSLYGVTNSPVSPSSFRNTCRKPSSTCEPSGSFATVGCRSVFL